MDKQNSSDELDAGLSKEREKTSDETKIDEENERLKRENKKQEQKIDSLEKELGKDNRKDKRLDIIRQTIWGCAVLLLLSIILMATDEIWLESKLAQSNNLTILITVTSTTLTTLVGAVIGTNID